MNPNTDQDYWRNLKWPASPNLDDYARFETDMLKDKFWSCRCPVYTEKSIALKVRYLC